MQISHPIRRPLFASLILLSSLLLPSHAQQMVEVQFVSIPENVSEKRIELLIGDGKSIDISIPTSHPSETYKVVRPKEWIIREKAPDGQNNEGGHVFGKCDSIDAAKQIVVVTPTIVANAGAEMHKLAVFSNDTADFVGGSYHLFNISTIGVSGNLGDRIFAIQPGTSTLLRPVSSEEKNGREYLYVTFKRGVVDNSKPFFSNTWRYNDKARTMVFIHGDSTGKNLYIRTIRSFTP